VDHTATATTTTMIITTRRGITAITTRTANRTCVGDTGRGRENDQTATAAATGAAITDGIWSIAAIGCNPTVIDNATCSSDAQRAAAGTAMIVRRSIATFPIAPGVGTGVEERP
jgi:hypothetical protein